MSISTKSKQNLLYIGIALAIVIASYVIFQISQSLNKKINYVYAKTGRITSFEEARAIVVRDEVILNTSSFSGEMQIKVLDSSKVAKNDVIASFVSKADIEENIQLEELDNQIQEQIESSDIEYSTDLKTLEKTIENNIYNIVKEKNNIYDVNITKKDLIANFDQKIDEIGKAVSIDSELHNLVEERKELEKNISSSKEVLRAPDSGLVSYRVDGYEKSFTLDTFSELSLKKIKQVKYLNNQQVPITTDKVKIIDNFYTYLVVITKSEEAKALHLNDRIKICLDTNFNSFERANVDYIIEDGKERILVLKIFGNSEKLSKYRAINAYLVWWNYEGIKVPNEAIYDTYVKYDENDEYGIKLKAVKIIGTTGYPKEAWIKEEQSAEGFTIISNYTDEELLNLNIPEELIEDRNQVNMYDKIVVNS